MYSARALVLALALVPATVRPQDRGAAALGGLVDGLSASARVLVIAAHPDDEDTQLITWLAKGRHVETAYLSLNRGDGGQNLLGNELSDALGAIRTEELLAARRIDGARQYFTRAYDFGFSKTADETFAQWPHDSVLRDVVTVIRAFRPHVIVAVFSGTPRDGHGHHQASGILAKEAYEIAGDTVRLPRSATAGLGSWTVQKFYRVARGTLPTVRMNVGEYDPLLGRSYGELADLSRSQHKSQAFGILQRKGVRLDGLALEASRVGMPAAGAMEQTIFDGIDTTWARFQKAVDTPASRAALDSLPSAFAAARARYDAYAPDRVVPALVRVNSLLDRLCKAGSEDECPPAAPTEETVAMPLPHPDLARSVEVARARVNAALARALGVDVEATANRETWALGENVPIQVVAYNRGARTVRMLGGIVDAGGKRSPFGSDAPILRDSTRTENTSAVFTVPSRPWWLTVPRVGSMFTPMTRGIEEGSRRAGAAAVTAIFAIDSATFSVSLPVVYRYADPLKGEMDRPIAAAPAITVLLDHDVEYAPANTPIERAFRVHVTSAASGAREVDVTLDVPNGLLVDSATRRVALTTAGSQRTVTFNVRGRLPVGRHKLEAVAASNGESFTTGYTAIDYDHIRTQRLYRPSTLALEAVDLKLPPNMRVAYIAGVGDNVEPTLEQLGVNVVPLDPATLSRADLSRFSAIVVGSRAYEANPALLASNANLLDYVKNGGTAVVQYGQYEMQQPGVLPYPITLARPADRVTVETAPVRITDPTASILNAPNRITANDFASWQQDLTLYMPRTFDPKYATMLEVSDPGETPNKAAILVAPYGKGTYVYTTLAFFRQLPNGVPGAARLFVNLLAARAERVTQ